MDKMINSSLNKEEIEKIIDITEKFSDEQMELVSKISEFYFRAGLKEGIYFKEYLLVN